MQGYALSKLNLLRLRMAEVSFILQLMKGKLVV
jgi:hypothetical protein